MPGLTEATSRQRTAAVEHLLTAQLRILLSCAERAYPAGSHMADALVPTDRLIWLEQGGLTYRFEDRASAFSVGAMWLVPAWTRRSWQAGTEGCRLSWVEFSLLPQEPELPLTFFEKAPLVLRPLMTGVLAVESACPLSARMGEMTLKYLIARMLAEAEVLPRTGSCLDRSLLPLVGLMRERLHEAHLLERLPRLAGLSDQALRRRFRQTMGTSPGRYLEGLRMRQARFLLASSDRSIKQIAAAVGYEDPLYFSRRYRTHWKRSPSEDRTPSP